MTVEASKVQTQHRMSFTMRKVAYDSSGVFGKVTSFCLLRSALKRWRCLTVREYGGAFWVLARIVGYVIVGKVQGSGGVGCQEIYATYTMQWSQRNKEWNWIGWADVKSGSGRGVANMKVESRWFDNKLELCWICGIIESDFVFETRKWILEGNFLFWYWQ